MSGEGDRQMFGFIGAALVGAVIGCVLVLAD
nr:MAG TPA: YtxH-like protein [Bacteriophage sp.]